MKKLREHIRAVVLIALGSAIYAAATQLFIFSNNLFLGGTSGVSVILAHFFPDFSSSEFLMLINAALMVLALLILGRGAAVKTMIGSVFTTFFIGLSEQLFLRPAPLIANPVLSALAGSAIISVGSAVLFSTDSSSGGTDILALIIRKYSSFPIGRALLAADVAIVVIGACISPPLIAVASVVGLIIKTFGIDIVIAFIQKWTK